MISTGNQNPLHDDFSVLTNHPSRGVNRPFIAHSPTKLAVPARTGSGKRGRRESADSDFSLRLPKDVMVALPTRSCLTFFQTYLSELSFGE